jgi:hypothetical protein
MKSQFSKRSGVLISVLVIFSTVSFSQIDNWDFLRAGPADGAAIAQAYLTPWANAFGAGVNGSWYNTAKVHKFGGFDITMGINVGIAPSSADYFDVTKIGLTTFSGTGNAPAISGPDVAGPVLSGQTITGVAPVTFETTPGLNWKYMPVPSLTAGIGLPFGTELKIRYVPKIPISTADISSWGLGLVHSIMQYFPSDKLMPFDVSLFGGYTRMEGNVPINLQPDDSKPHNYSSAYPAGSFDNQKLGMTVEALNISAIASLNLKIISFYGGLGYSKTSTLIKLTGNFPLPSVNTSISLTEPVYEDAGVLKDFPDINIKNFSGVRANIGFRLKFAVVTIHADYTRAQYNVLSAGLGISIR